jgi:hypothetical protein
METDEEYYKKCKYYLTTVKEVTMEEFVEAERKYSGAVPRIDRYPVTRRFWSEIEGGSIEGKIEYNLTTVENAD